MVTQKKKDIVLSLVEKLKSAKAVYLTDYHGMSVSELSDLRKKIKSENADYIVVKNTLFRIALKDSQFSIPNCQLSNLQGPTAVILAYSDPIKPLHIFAETSKDRFKSAFAFGEYLLGNSLNKLVSLEPQEVLQTKLVFYISSPLFRLSYALNWNLQRLTTAINAIKRAKGGESDG